MVFYYRKQNRERYLSKGALKIMEDERDYPPIKCHCGNYKEEHRNVCIQDGVGEVEYDLYCKNCGKYLGYFCYGSWEY